MSDLDHLEPVLTADEVQVNILGGFNEDHQAVLPLRSGDGPPVVTAVRLWVAEIPPDITWLREVVEYKRERRRRIDAEGEEPTDMPSSWRNVAISFPASAS